REIGDYSNGVITIDQTADGAGWYVGTDNSEFGPGPNGTMVALTGSDAAQHFDLLTVLEHEYGHVLGLPDIPDGVVAGALMNTSLTEGVRILPSTKDLDTPPAIVTPVAPVVTLADMQAQLNSVATGSAAPTTDPAPMFGVLASADPADPPAGPLANGNFAVTDP